MPYHNHTVTNEISMMKKSNQQSFGIRRLCRSPANGDVSCYWDTAAGGSVKTSRAPVLNASVHLVTAEPQSHICYMTVRKSWQCFCERLVYQQTRHTPASSHQNTRSSLPASVTATSSPFLFLLFSSCTPYLRPTSQHISQVVLATEGAAQSDSSPVHLR